MAHHRVFGCWCVRPTTPASFPPPPPYSLPQVQLQAYTSIHSTVSRTKLKQSFMNDTATDMSEVQYSFPLYDGVSVVSFKCTIGDKVIFGVVKEKNQARTEFNEAKARGEATALLEQTNEVSDIFVTRIGKVPSNARAVVEIEYVGELTHDAQLDGIRFTIPRTLAPRYGTVNSDLRSALQSRPGTKINILVDIEVDDDTKIQTLNSPSHVIQRTMGRTSVHMDTTGDNRASATLVVKDDCLEKDFVLVVKSAMNEVPKALLEEHPTIPNHKAVMATLVPRFNLPNISPEIVFVIDRSGSMEGKMPLVIEALGVFLKSLPLGAKFNLCSFGSTHSLMFLRSIPYDEQSLQYALSEVGFFGANFGGTELLTPIQHVVQNRLDSVPLEIMVLTDGEIWNQQQTFDFVNQAAKSDVRVFSLGIGAGASSSLVRGLARAGNGFAQFVQDNEKMDRLVVRMLKAALTPHITDYRLELQYDEADPTSDDDFEMVEPPTKPTGQSIPVRKKEENPGPTTISLFDPNFKEEAPNPPASRYDHLPEMSSPKELQAPSEITGLFPYNRVSAYVLLSNSIRKIKSVTLRGTYQGTPLKLDIPIRNIGTGKTVHQLAAKKGMLELEEGRGWLVDAISPSGGLLKDKHSADWDRIVEREAVRLGVQFQLAGKFCSFVAVETQLKTPEKQPAQSSVEAETDLDYSVFDNNPSDWDLTALGNRELLSISLRETKPNHAISPKFGGALSFNNISMAAPMMQQAQPQSRQSFGSTNPAMGFGLFGSTSVTGGSALFGSSATTDEGRRVQKRSESATKGTPDMFRRSSNQAEGKVSGLPGAASQGHVTSNSTRGGLFGKPSQGGIFNGPPSSTTGGFGSSVTPPGGVFRKAANSVGGALFGGSRRARTGAPSSVGNSFAPPPAQAPNPFPASAFAPPPAPASSFGSSSQSSTTKLHQVIALQRFDGSWTASDDLLKLLGVWRGDFDDADLSLLDTSDKDTVKATILAIAWLEKEAADEAEVWDMIAEKAKAWVSSNSGHNFSITDVEVEVGKAVAIFFP